MKRRQLLAAAVIGIGLIAAPAVFQMFSRAPKGAEMIDEFRQYMDGDTVDKFQRYMAEIDAANAELTTELPTLLESRAGVAAADIPARFTSVASFEEQWPGIEADMNDDMLLTIEEMLPNFAAVDALPPFTLFPWFFVLPGLFVAVVAGAAFWRARRGQPARPLAIAVAGLGIAIVLAPAIFQMFSRAPQGKEMIDEFVPLMTTERVATIQGYFLVIGAGEGQLRTQVLPLLEENGVSRDEWAAAMPAVARFTETWPTISNDMAPMIGTMSDNVDNFHAVKALPPFSLFPWFFVAPGLLIAGLGVVAARGARSTVAPERDAERVSIIEQADAETARLERRGT